MSIQQEQELQSLTVQYLPLSGGSTNAMQGDLYMGGHIIFNLHQLSFSAGTTVGTSSICYDASAVALGNNANALSPSTIALGTNSKVNFGPGGIAIGPSCNVTGTNAICIAHNTSNSNAETAIIGDVAFTDISSGSTTCDLGNVHAFQNLHLSGAIKTDSTSVPASRLLFSSGTIMPGNVATFVSSNELQDAGTSLSQYLLLSGGRMIGNLDMGAAMIQNVFRQNFTASILIGNGVGQANPYDNTGILIGGNASSNDANTITIGNGAATQNGAGIAVYSIAIGQNAITGGGNSDVTDSIAIGHNANVNPNNSYGWGSIAFGAASSVQANGAMALGPNAINTHSLTAVIGGSNFSDISSNSTTCDLGFWTPFQNLYLSQQAYVNRHGVSWSSFSMFLPFILANTTTMTSLSTGPSVGSMTFPSSNAGQFMDLECGATIACVGSPYVTFLVTLNGLSICSVVVNPLPNTTTCGKVKATLTIGPTSVSVNLDCIMNGIMPMASCTSSNYDPTSSNTFDLVAQWSEQNTNNILTVTNLHMVTHGFNASNPP
jgi:hypothetical protein